MSGLAGFPKIGELSPVSVAVPGFRGVELHQETGPAVEWACAGQAAEPGQVTWEMSVLTASDRRCASWRT